MHQARAFVILGVNRWLPSAAAEASKILFKSEVAGTDLPFSDAAFGRRHALHIREGGLIPGTRTVPEDPKEEARLLMEDFSRSSSVLR